MKIVVTLEGATVTKKTTYGPATAILPTRTYTYDIEPESDAHIHHLRALSSAIVRARQEWNKDIIAQEYLPVPNAEAHAVEVPQLTVGSPGRD